MTCLLQYSLVTPHPQPHRRATTHSHIDSTRPRHVSATLPHQRRQSVPASFSPTPYRWMPSFLLHSRHVPGPDLRAHQFPSPLCFSVSPMAFLRSVRANCRSVTYFLPTATQPISPSHSPAQQIAHKPTIAPSPTPLDAIPEASPASSALYHNMYITHRSTLRSNLRPDVPGPRPPPASHKFTSYPRLAIHIAPWLPPDNQLSHL